MGAVGGAEYDEGSRWWRHELLHRYVLAEGFASHSAAIRERRERFQLGLLEKVREFEQRNYPPDSDYSQRTEEEQQQDQKARADLAQERLREIDYEVDEWWKLFAEKDISTSSSCCWKLPSLNGWLYQWKWNSLNRMAKIDKALAAKVQSIRKQQGHKKTTFFSTATKVLLVSSIPISIALLYHFYSSKSTPSTTH